MTQLPYLNLGAGRIILPGPQPQHHGLVDAAIYAYPLWHNVDRNPEPGIDETVDLFRYPWPWADNSFDGALLTHICEHIPHEIHLGEVSDAYLEDIPYSIEPGMKRPNAEWLARTARAEQCQDGWYAFFAELHRVLTPGAVAHILSPYAWSQGAMTDPSHTRYLTEHVWTHSMQPDPNSPFKYETGGLNFEMAEAVKFGPTPLFAHLLDDKEEWFRTLQTRLNVAYEMSVKLRAVK